MVSYLKGVLLVVSYSGSVMNPMYIYNLMRCAIIYFAQNQSRLLFRILILLSSSDRRHGFRIFS